MHTPRARTLLTTGLIATGLLAATASLAWGQGLEGERRLLPGTTVAGADVGGATVEVATQLVHDHLGDRHATDIDVHAADARWSVSADELGARPDVDAAVTAAFTHTQDAGPVELATHRLLDRPADVEMAVDTDLDPQAVDRLITEVADEVEQAARDAALAWTGDAVELSEARTGRTLDRDAATDRLAAAVLDPRPQVELPVTTTDPSIATEDLAPLVDEVERRSVAALDREIALTGPELDRTLTPRGLGATPDLETLLDALPTDGRGELSVTALPDAATVPLEVDDDAVDAVLDDLAGEVERPARDAQLDWSTGDLDIVAERTGRTLDVDATRAQLLDAIDGGPDGADDRVELTTDAVQPTVTRDDHDQVLFLQQDRRTLQLYEDGEAVREWPVAVGQHDAATPTGTFTVGAKRVEPTWTNPAPDGWGADLPDVVEAGPDNPLGARALNWNRDGRDTLIRFHGTNEPGSIGQAASRGCVRMHDEHVIELYDRVARGTTIVSTAG